MYIENIKDDIIASSNDLLTIINRLLTANNLTPAGDVVSAVKLLVTLDPNILEQFAFLEVPIVSTLRSIVEGSLSQGDFAHVNR